MSLNDLITSVLIKFSLLLVILILAVSSLFSQDQVHYLKIEGSEISVFKNKAKKLKRYRFNEIEDLNLKLENLKSYLIEKGYLETNIDSTYIIADTLYAIFHIGKPYYWKNIDLVVDGNTGEYPLEFRFPYLNLTSFKEIKGKQLDILDYCLSHGYPFSRLNVSELEIENGQIDGICNVNLNQRVVWDSMLVKGDSKINTKFLENHLGIKPGRVYNEKKFEAISGLIEKLDFVSEIKSSELEFFHGVAKVHNYLKKESANRFDGIIGFQNNNKTDKLELTGEVNLSLVNSFRRGEHIQFNWRKLEETSQTLKLGLQYPYIFNSKLGTDFSFQLLKQDSSYVNTNLSLGLNFQLSNNSVLNLFYQLKSSSLISTKQFAGITVLPDFADSKSNLLGFQYKYRRLDREFNPLKGWDLKLKIAGGENKIKKNIKIPDELYNDIELETKIFESSFSLKNYIPIRSKWVFHWHVMGAWMKRENYFENDLFRLGGMKTIRGFNEDSFRASKYAIARQEFRFVPSQTTSIYLFYDYAWYEQEILNKNLSDRPKGYGFGFNFSTGSGLFTLNYALGSQNEQSSDLKSAKIHFGFIAKF